MEGRVVMPRMSKEEEELYKYRWEVAPYDTPEGRAAAPEWVKDRFQKEVHAPVSAPEQSPSMGEGTMPEATYQERWKRPLTIRGWSFFDKVRFRWGGAGDILLGISLIGGAHNIVFGVLFIILGIATWVYTKFGNGDTSLVVDADPGGWYTAWNSMSTAGRVIAGIGSVIGVLFLYIVFFWFVIAWWFWKYIIAPGLRS
jgi:hypothetical protein